jgi:hypothetical protein
MGQTVRLFKTYRIWSILFYGSFVLATVAAPVQVLIVLAALMAMGVWAIVWQEIMSEANVPDVEEPAASA